MGIDRLAIVVTHVGQSFAQGPKTVLGGIKERIFHLFRHVSHLSMTHATEF